MSAYALITVQPLSQQDRLKLKVMYPDNQEINGSAFVIQSDQTTKEISEKLFASGNPPHLIFRISSFWGRYRTDFWEWLTKSQSEPVPG